MSSLTCMDGVLQQLRSGTFSAEPRFAKLDIKDFYMRGSAAKHASVAFLDEKSDLRRALRGALEALIGFQYVKVEHECADEGYYWVQEGSGMGQIASGEIADTTFLELAEAKFASLSSIQHEYRIQAYIRYRDDIIIIGDDVDLLRAFIWTIKDMVRGVYELELSEYSRSSISFLAFFVSKSS